MPLGCFLVTIDPAKGPKYAARFFEGGKDSYKLTDELLLRLQMIHSSKQQSTLSLEDSVLLTRSYEDRLNHLIVVIVLTPLDKPESFLNGLKDSIQVLAAKKATVKDQLDKFLEDIYFEYYRTPQVTLDSKKLEENIKEKAKKLLQSGKTKEAEELLEKATKLKIPKKLYDTSTKAEHEIKKGDYEKAARYYLEAADYASELGEGGLSEFLRDKAKNSQKLPQFMEQRNQAASDARKALREDKFELAAQLFRKAAELSNEMLDTQKVEEFTLKAKALQEFASVEKKYR
jgi:tetratricopeptide (TPR) repeat protein